jgi:hypothetical protein
MESIEADIDGLSALGAVCKREAEALRVIRPLPVIGSRFQATTIAIDSVLKMTDRAENLISMRLRVTGHTIVSAAGRLANCDSTSRERIAAV